MPLLTLTPPARTSVATRIVVESGSIDAIEGEILTLGGFDSYVVTYDEGVEQIARRVLDALTKAKLHTHALPVKGGDASKSLAEVDRLAGKMLELGCGRSTLVIAVGGGMMTDLGGFLASVFMRGVPSILVPTSMLAMVDAAIGGKTAVNCSDHKNMIGTISHPLSVIIDLSLLQSLPEAQLTEGLTEAVKIAAIVDAPYFEWLEKHLKKVLDRDPKALEECVVRAISAKIKTVESDESDWTERLYLNFGHTVGHAVEAMSKYSLPHGQAVSIGMVAEMEMTGFSGSDRVKALLKQLNMPMTIPDAFGADDLWKLMLVDKKSVAGAVRSAVPSELGKGTLATLSRGAFDSLFRP